MNLRCLILFIPLLFLGANSYSQETLTDNEKIATLCKVWGFLKYYHPAIAKGKVDWDKEFLTHFSKIISTQNKQELSIAYLEWIKSLGAVKSENKRKHLYSNGFIDSESTTWIKDTKLFTDSLVASLTSIKKSKYFRRNYYVKHYLFVGNTRYPNEKSYPDSIFPVTTEMRLLCLARYWNIINYYFPYKYVIDEDWNNVLAKMIPKFINVSDITNYHFAMMELAASTNDSHAWFVPSLKDFGTYFLPFWSSIAENKLVVTYLFNDSLAGIDDIKVSDVITSINDKGIQNIIDESGKFISASNEATKKYNAAYIYPRGTTNTVKVTIERDGISTTKIIHRYPEYSLRNHSKNEGSKTKKEETKHLPWKILKDSIGYVNMGNLQRSQVSKMMRNFANTKAIIFDVRNYPNGTMYKIAKYLNKEKKPFAKFTCPTMTEPGIFEFTKPFYCGRKNKNYYKGKVILLINEETESHAEFTCMALNTAPNVTCIGSQTAGADGNISEIILPGGYTLYMSGIGVYYPDGKETQRVGIVPDIEVKPTVAGTINKKDEVMQRALDYINDGK